MLAAALALAACGEDDKDGDGASGAGPKAVTISETEFALDPAKPKLEKPGVVDVVAKNDGKVVHALEVEGPAREVETKTIEPGESAKLTIDFDEPGRYGMYCPVGDHRERGMKGEVVVAGGGSAKPEDDSGGGGGGY